MGYYNPLTMPEKAAMIPPGQVDPADPDAEEKAELERKVMEELKSEAGIDLISPVIDTRQTCKLLKKFFLPHSYPTVNRLAKEGVIRFVQGAHRGERWFYYDDVMAHIKKRHLEHVKYFHYPLDKVEF